ncbi:MULTISPECIES: gamma-glutamylcyclotransferase family protein [Streptomyces]|uniref:gamma-glutamylcyclotransferase family protein n=1 Tax=Streptomyces TaxID=1883 RepID=UPI00224926AE|nr:gamma-glutamylcyclotransferase family protein [Streptomyces sp. JHD 1]MCX2971700.1 gamma-glutamylcyclotransferase [Streptomyces sp. JHD 1]
MNPAAGPGARLPFFVYGTLRPGERHHAWTLAGRTVREESARVHGLVLYEGPGYPYAVAGRGTVTGALIEPEPAAYADVLRLLDELERYTPGGAANLYERGPATVHLADGATRTAWLYTAAPPLAARLRASGTVVPGGDWPRGAG